MKKIILSLIPVLMIMAVIFFFSSQDASNSVASSSRFTKLAIRLLYPDYDTLPEEEQYSVSHRMSRLVRKTAHFSEFGALGFFLLLHVNEISRYTGGRPKRRYLLSWLIGTLYAVSDEVHQFFSAGRSPGVNDVLLDSAGVAAGAALMLLILMIGTGAGKRVKASER